MERKWSESREEEKGKEKRIELAQLIFDKLGVERRAGLEKISSQRRFL